MALINKHFGKSELNKYYNRKTIKISYSCMPNLETVISGHTRKLLNAPVSRQEKRTCICRKWPATYIGLASNTFKERFTNHQSSFKHQSQKEGTALSKLGTEGAKKSSQHLLVHCRNSPAYNPNSRTCHLCLMEKERSCSANVDTEENTSCQT